MRTKSNPQSRIHEKCSAVVGLYQGLSSGEKKSSKLNPFHRGKRLTTGSRADARAAAGAAARVAFSATDDPKAITLAVRINFLRCIPQVNQFQSPTRHPEV